MCQEQVPAANQMDAGGSWLKLPHDKYAAKYAMHGELNLLLGGSSICPRVAVFMLFSGRLTHERHNAASGTARQSPMQHVCPSRVACGHLDLPVGLGGVTHVSGHTQVQRVGTPVDGDVPQELPARHVPTDTMNRNHPVCVCTENTACKLMALQARHSMPVSR